MSRIFKTLARNTFTIALWTFISRILGFLRDILIASFFGTSPTVEAFLVAFRFPNMFRALLGEGAVDSVIIPVLSEYKTKPDFFLRVRHTLLASSVVLFGVTCIGILSAKVLVFLMAPGFAAHPEHFALTVKLTQIVFFYLFFVGFSANAGGFLYLENNFFVPSFAPVLSNIVFIVGVIISALALKNPAFGLAAMVLVSGVLQAAWESYFLRGKIKIHFDYKAAFSDSAVCKIFRLSLPRVWGVAVYQLNLLVDGALASFSWIVGTGAIAAVYYSNRLIQFPLALFSLAVSRASIPKLASYWAEKNSKDFLETIRLAFGAIAFLLVPTSMAFFVLAKPLIEITFQRGKFDADSVLVTSLALMFYSLGLFFYGGVNLLTSVFYALKDTLIPAKTATLALLLNVVLSLILMFPLKIGGVALASSISASLNFFLLGYLLQKRILWYDAEQKREFFKILAASFSMGLLLFVFWEFLPLRPLLLKFFIAFIGGFCVFFVFAFFLRVESLRQVLGILRGKLSLSRVFSRKRNK